jgi:hypothetical protein
MSLRVFGLIGFIVGVWSNAQAITCYEIIDASDNTLYRASVPPFALNGTEWSTGQTRLRQQRRHLLWFDAASCPENFSSPAYASVKPAEDATDLLPARAGFNQRGGIYTRETASSGAVGAAGRVPVVVAPAGAPMGAPVGGAPGYGR